MADLGAFREVTVGPMGRMEVRPLASPAPDTIEHAMPPMMDRMEPMQLPLVSSEVALSSIAISLKRLVDLLEARDQNGK